MKLSGELEYRIRYDVEHDLFHAQNVFSDEYITPTFVEYVQKLEKENAENESEARELNIRLDRLIKENAELQHKVDTLQGFLDRDVEFDNLQKENAELKEANATLATMNNSMWVELEKKRAESQGITNKLHQLIKAKDIIKELLSSCFGYNSKTVNYEVKAKAEAFLKE